MILIVGAGPAGSLAAIFLGKKREVLIAEEHQSAGFPVQCAGLISKRCFEEYRKICKVNKAFENRIKGAFFFSPSGICIDARGDACVVERKIFDEILFLKASEFAKTFVKTQVKFLGREALVGDKKIHPDFVIGADGVCSTVARSFNFKRPKILSALQIEARFEALDENFVEIYFGKRFSDCFFAYAIPLGDTARIGVICKRDANLYLKNFIDHLGKRVKASMLELNAGSIPSELIDFVKDRIALIGDAAGMVKPYTGGGLYYLLVAAKKLASSFPDLKAYKKSFMEELGREINAGMKIREIYSLSDKEIDKIFEFARNFDLSSIDMDRPSTAFSMKFFVRSLPKILPKLDLEAFKLLPKLLRKLYM